MNFSTRPKERSRTFYNDWNFTQIFNYGLQKGFLCHGILHRKIFARVFISFHFYPALRFVSSISFSLCDRFLSICISISEYSTHFWTVHVCIPCANLMECVDCIPQKQIRTVCTCFHLTFRFYSQFKFLYRISLDSAAYRMFIIQKISSKE